mmetsp:Transcript_21190/g.18811  ORF Transcript_21190/g.18811 Transcript_21190/m.18811 type:complete len:234 (-) Transcript_21190:110-811(-)
MNLFKFISTSTLSISEETTTERMRKYIIKCESLLNLICLKDNRYNQPSQSGEASTLSFKFIIKIIKILIFIISVLRRRLYFNDFTVSKPSKEFSLSRSKFTNFKPKFTTGTKFHKITHEIRERGKMKLIKHERNAFSELNRKSSRNTISSRLKIFLSENIKVSSIKIDENSSINLPNDSIVSKFKTRNSYLFQGCSRSKGKIIQSLLIKSKKSKYFANENIIVPKRQKRNEIR